MWIITTPVNLVPAQINVLRVLRLGCHPSTPLCGISGRSQVLTASLHVDIPGRFQVPYHVWQSKCDPVQGARRARNVRCGHHASRRRKGMPLCSSCFLSCHVLAFAKRLFWGLHHHYTIGRMQGFLGAKVRELTVHQTRKISSNLRKLGSWI